MIEIYQKIENEDGSYIVRKIIDDASGSIDIKDGVWNAYVEGTLPSEGEVRDELLTKVPNGGLVIDDTDGVSNDMVEQLAKDWVTYIPGILSLEGDNIDYLTRYVPEGGLIVDDE